jgi:hypothetical protein
MAAPSCPPSLVCTPTREWTPCHRVASQQHSFSCAYPLLRRTTASSVPIDDDSGFRHTTAEIHDGGGLASSHATTQIHGGAKLRCACGVHPLFPFIYRVYDREEMNIRWAVVGMWSAPSWQPISGDESTPGWGRRWVDVGFRKGKGGSKASGGSMRCVVAAGAMELKRGV